MFRQTKISSSVFEACSIPSLKFLDFYQMSRTQCTSPSERGCHCLGLVLPTQAWLPTHFKNDESGHNSLLASSVAKFLGSHYRTPSPPLHQRFTPYLALVDGGCHGLLLLLLLPLMEHCCSHFVTGSKVHHQGALCLRTHHKKR